ncbi:MAG: hypothetical protein NVSMB18_19340 [Acetobacteraceae bacterium]
MAATFDRADAPALGVRKVLTQALHDLYGTKDVQNAITASYVWLADQLGHLTLGLVPTLLVCWAVRWLGGIMGAPPVVVCLGMVTLALAIFGYWVFKERQDLAETKANAGNIFPFDLSDIEWNVSTALLYFGIGGALAVAAFQGFLVLLPVLLVSLWPAAMVAYWWLRRKLAFQQAGLPYLYRLANFTGAFERPEAKQAITVASGLCDIREQPVSWWHVLTGYDPIRHKTPKHPHLLITGPLRSGKTSLAVGIGTEFAFVLGLCRYLSAIDLVELAAAKPGPQRQMDYDDGRVLWPWNEVKLLVVDDVDAGVALPPGPGQAGTACSLVRPADFVAAMQRASGSLTPLAWLRHRRSVWVIGDPAAEQSWQAAIAELMGAAPDAILPMQLNAPLPAPVPQPRRDSRGKTAAVR